MRGLWENEDIGKGRSTRSSTQENKVGRDTEGAPSGDDADMLGEVGEEDAEDDQAVRVMLVAADAP